jgi:23S rRNA pseudouridine1911/1915/1917 synthase
MLPADRGTIDQAIGRHPVHRKKMSTETRAGRQAITHWQVLRRYEADRLCLVDLRLETGRTHQIRVHLAGINCPVVGDPLYGSSRTRSIGDPALRQMVSRLGRQFLHAWQLGFVHPDGCRMIFQAPLPLELQEILDYLEEKYHCQPADLKIAARAERMEAVSHENCKTK